MKTVKAEIGEIKFNRKRPASAALQHIDNENSLDQDIVWTSKVACLVATNKGKPSEESILRSSKKTNMNADTNNNNGVKEEEVSVII